MKIAPLSKQINFSAKLNERTRDIIKTLDKEYHQNLESRVDAAIKNSPLADFFDERATISFLETENPHCNIAPVVNLNMNGIIASYVLKGSSSVCEEQDEEFLLEKMQRRPHRYINTIINRLNSESISQIREGLSLDYSKKLSAKNE